MRKPSVLVVFLTVFIDLIGFGIVLPLLPIYSRNLTSNGACAEAIMGFFGRLGLPEESAGGLIIGAIMASYSLMQFLFAPGWGRLSDRIGRRPVLLVSTAGAAISYALFALGSRLSGDAALWLLLGSRLFAGICGANITVAQAYIADITPPQDRSKKMGLIGMAFGLGFIFGPALGGFGIHLFGVQGPGWLAAGLCAANFVLAFLILPESWKPNSEHVAVRPRLAQWGHTLSHPQIGLLVLVFFLATFCFTCFETTLGLLVGRNFQLDINSDQDAKVIGYLFAYCGIIGATVQGGAIGRLVKKSGEPKLIANSLLLVGISMAPLPFIHGSHVLAWLLLLATLGLLSVGSSLTRPPVFGLISNLTPPQEQGATIGVAQSAGSLARILGPIFAATLLYVRPWLPYLICSAISLLTAAVVLQRLCRSAQPLVTSNTPTLAK